MKNQDNSHYIGKFLEKDYNQFRDGLLELLDDYKRKSQRLDKIIKQSDKMQLQLLKANEQLDEYKNNLEKKVDEEIKKRKEKELMLLAQSRFAAMGEMIDSIAHQWSQPLGIINMHLSSLEFDFENGKVDKQYIEDFQKKLENVTKHMNTTLIEFRTFFRTNKEQKEFSIKNMIDKVLLFIKDEFIKEKITIKIDIPNDFMIDAIENEFKHILLNIINNSKDAFNRNNISNRVINIKAYEEKKEQIVEISDNAGGIDEELLDDIFKANVSIKDSNESGIGLYMSSLIAQKNHIVIGAENIKDGAKFIIRK
ncbi:MAG: ATP-binding protein [Halarcobacter sp.]